MLKFSNFIIIFLILLTEAVFASSKIYLIRHAEVQIKNPGWCNTKETQSYKEEYNIAQVRNFNPDIVLEKIDNSESIDTVFCSPQLRALETAGLLFNNQIALNINKNLMELDYSVIRVPLLKLPVKVWLTISRISWMAGVNRKENPTLKQRIQSLEEYSNELIAFTEMHGESVVIAHGAVNREMIKILKKKGWKLGEKDGFGNLSVNCLIK